MRPVCTRQHASTSAMRPVSTGRGSSASRRSGYIFRLGLASATGCPMRQSFKRVHSSGSDRGQLLRTDTRSVGDRDSRVVAGCHGCSPGVHQVCCSAGDLRWREATRLLQRARENRGYYSEFFCHTCSCRIRHRLDSPLNGCTRNSSFFSCATNSVPYCHMSNHNLLRHEFDQKACLRSVAPGFRCYCRGGSDGDASGIN